jgi:two-component sensor histidine kinase
MGDAHDLAGGHRVPSAHPPELRLRLRSRPEAPLQARQALAVFADALPAETLADLRLIVTELVTNSVKYGPGVSIGVTVVLDEEGNVCGDVADGGDGDVRMTRSSDPADGGLGLQIVDALTSEWGVRPETSNVWFVVGQAV